MDYVKLMRLCGDCIDSFVVTDKQSELLLAYMRDDHAAAQNVFDYHLFDVADDNFRKGANREIGDVPSVVKAVTDHAARLSVFSMEIMEALEDTH